MLWSSLTVLHVLPGLTSTQVTTLRAECENYGLFLIPTSIDMEERVLLAEEHVLAYVAGSCVSTPIVVRCVCNVCEHRH
jgi:hypothetical protein